jgi:hypothetical protein
MFWEELITYFPFTAYLVSDTKHGPHRKHCIQKFFCCVFTESLPTSDMVDTKTQDDLIRLLLFLKMTGG